MNVEEMQIKLYNKLLNELNERLEEIKKRTPEQIIERAYEITIKKEIVDFFDWCNQNVTDNEEELKTLLEQENLLNTFYDSWLSKCCINFEDVQYCVERGTEFIMNKIKMKGE